MLVKYKHFCVLNFLVFLYCSNAQNGFWMPMINSLGKFRAANRDVALTFAEVIKQSTAWIQQTLHKTCISVVRAMSKSKFGSVEVDKLKVRLKNGEASKSFKIDELSAMLKDEEYMQGKGLTLFIPGWMNENDRMTSLEVKLMSEAFAKRKDVNFALLDISGPMPDIASWVLYPSQQVGAILGENLANLRNSGLAADDIHLIGASVGAHIAGFAGSFYRKKTGRGVGRVTGLDPASICLNARTNTNGISTVTANFVDVIHTSSVFGYVEAVGHVDIYVNRMSANQPGCDDTVCSHKRAVELFAESAVPGQEENFVVRECSSRISYVIGMCERNPTSFMGLKMPYYTRGTFHLNTKSESPYGYGYKPQTDAPPGISEINVGGLPTISFPILLPQPVPVPAPPTTTSI